MKPPPEIAEAIRRIREQSGIRLDRDGRFWHRGALIEHAGVARLFHRSIARDALGRIILSIGNDWAVIEIEDCPYVVRALALVGDGVRLYLDDETEERLVPRTLRLGRDGVLRCRVKVDAFDARLSRPAQAALAPALEEREGCYVLALEDGIHPIDCEAP